MSLLVSVTCLEVRPDVVNELVNILNASLLQQLADHPEKLQRDTREVVSVEL